MGYVTTTMPLSRAVCYPRLRFAIVKVCTKVEVFNSTHCDDGYAIHVPIIFVICVSKVLKTENVQQQVLHVSHNARTEYRRKQLAHI